MREVNLLTAQERAMFKWGEIQGVITERAAIVAWLREPQDESVTPWCELLADSIENGEHLRGDDE